MKDKFEQKMFKQFCHDLHYTCSETYATFLQCIHRSRHNQGEHVKLYIEHVVRQLPAVMTQTCQTHISYANRQR